MHKNPKKTLILFLISNSLLVFSQRTSHDDNYFAEKKMLPILSSNYSQHISFHEQKDYNFEALLTSMIEIIQPIEKEINSSNLTYAIDYKPGFKCNTEIGYSMGVGDYAIDYMKLNSIFSYKLNPYTSVGLGAGLRYAMQVKDVLIPFFIDFRANANKKNFPFYIAFDLGYSLDVTSDFKTEGLYLLFNPSVGANISLSDKSTINVGIGYDFLKYKMNYSTYGVIPGTTINTTGISLNTGISF